MQRRSQGRPEPDDCAAAAGIRARDVEIGGRDVLAPARLHHLALAQIGTNGRSFSTGFSSLGINAEELGDGGRVAIGPSGRIWWNLSSKFPVIVGFPYLLVTQ